jgi:long-chain acyl-CoA synthetase
MNPTTITASVVRHATRERDALVIGLRRRTYADLAAGIEATAALLASSGLPRRSRAGILLDPGTAFFEAFLGAGAAGMAAMVLQRSWSDRELHQALAAGRPALLLANRRLPGYSVVQVGDDGVRSALMRWTGGSPRAPRTPVDPRSPFYIGFTSGTTGRPKGFVRSHRSWLRSFDTSAVFGIAKDDHVLAPGPLDHSLFLYAAVHGLSVGATVHLVRRFAPAAVLATLQREPITRVYLVPTMLAALLRAIDRGGAARRFPNVRSVICSGARWPVAVQERVAEVFPNAEPLDFYGASELSFVSLRRLRSGDPPDSVGQPFPGVELAVRRPDGTEVGVGEAGRLWVRSDMLFDGYLEPQGEGEHQRAGGWGSNSAEGAQRDEDGWMTVGDMARRDAEGHLYLIGREGAMLICGGVNVFPEEVEDVLMQVPEIAEAAVIGVPDDYWGEVPCALVRWHDGRALPRRRLRDHCRLQLAREKRPQRWLQVADLPRTGTGKIARAALAQRLHDGSIDARELR